VYLLKNLENATKFSCIVLSRSRKETNDEIVQDKLSSILRNCGQSKLAIKAFYRQPEVCIRFIRK